MITYKRGNIFTSDVEAIVNTVNCVGVMGRGIALQYKKQYPDNFKFYEASCKRGEVKPGKMLMFPTNSFCNPKYIINFPTKRHWRGASNLGDVQSGLDDLHSVIKSHDIKSIAIPPLGCGLGGLDWNDVKCCIERALSSLEGVDIEVYEPNGAPNATEMAKNRSIPKMTAGRAALVMLTKKYLDGLLDPFISLLEVHKLMYLMQESGFDLRLRYVKAPHGPYAENLSHVLNAVEGYFLSGYADGGDRPDKQLSLVPGADADAENYLLGEPDTAQHIKRVVTLVDGYETSFGMELLSTVHWLAQHEGIAKNNIIENVYAWSEYKEAFSSRQIENTWLHLEKFGWLS